jgi:hypothetical protein
MSESINELTAQAVEAALPGMIDVLVEDFHTPGKVSMSDKIKMVELFMKQRGLLQQEKQGNFLPVEINFISAGEVTVRSGSEVQTLEVQAVELLETTVAQVAEEVQQASAAPDPFDQLASLLEDV